MTIYKPHYLLTVLLTAFGLTACGGGSGEGSGTGNRTTGAVTDKNATTLAVAGATFTTTSANVTSDEVGNDVGNIAVGMVVSVESDASGNAADIEYDAEVEGKVDYIDGATMTVVGQNVDITQNPTFVSEMPDITDVASIPQGAMVEVSGYSDGMGNIIATYVKLEDHMATESDEMEVEGIVNNLDLVNGTFQIGGQVIHFDPNNISITMEEGLNVEVDIMMVGDEYHATEIEIEDDYGDEHGEGHEIEIEGIVSGDLGEDGSFMINGETVMLGDNVEYEHGLTRADIVDGAHLEVEGHLNANGMLIVSEVEPPGTSDDDSSVTESDSTSGMESTDPLGAPDTL